MIAFENRLLGKQFLNVLVSGSFGTASTPSDQDPLGSFRFKRPGGVITRLRGPHSTSLASSFMGSIEEEQECRPTDNGKRPL
ncbi:hypothetical protein [Bradyrhizobium sp. BR 1432]|uniref:hypothetical protein n=1 Tax=Bradyrhizobium sp. BR 1432 TaxID=3447966 RepID=UPI003EE7D4A5